MKILKIKLENVKSYEDGPVVELHQGVNFVSGKNGSGKTTLLESMGFAIFDYSPYSNILKMVRDGCVKGKMTVWFSFDDDIVYRSERKIGSGANTWTIYEEGDETEIVSGAKETKDWIREKIGVPEDMDISKTYSDIIGVSQGEITTYFKNSRETARKDHFNPIIGVEDYREAFKRTSSVPNNIQLKIKDIVSQIDQIKAKTEKYGEDYQGVEIIAKKHLALIYIIESYKKCPEYFPIKCLYPLIFHFHYLKAKYRQISIKQFERFLNEFLEYKTGSIDYKQICYDIFYDDNTKTLGNKLLPPFYEYEYISGYLVTLGRLYLGEYSYDKLMPLIKKLIELGEPMLFYDLVIQFFRRQHKLDEGIAFVEGLKKRYLKKELFMKKPDKCAVGAKDDEDSVIVLFQLMTSRLIKYKTKKPYKQHPMKKEEITEELLTI